MVFMRLKTDVRQALEFEVVSTQARTEFTRLIRRACKSDDHIVQLIRENEFINIAHNVLELPIYRLDPDGYGDFEPAEFAWHHSRRELIMRTPTTSELVEILADYLQQGDVGGIRSKYCSRKA